MANPKNETSLAELKQRFADTDSLVLTEYRGLTVAQTTELRKALGADVQYSIANDRVDLCSFNADAFRTNGHVRTEVRTC